MFRVKKSDLDNTGRMKAWLIEEGEWIWRYPVDVAEMLKRGAVTLDGPPEAPPAVPEPVVHPSKKRTRKPTK
jgi:hypothetical protein